MDREEAIKILKGMISTHFGDIVTSIVIVRPNEVSNTLSYGYQIHIKGSPYHHLKDLEAKIKPYGLTVEEVNGTIIIYKSKC